MMKYLLPIVLILFASPALADAADELEQLRKENAELRAQVEALKAQLEAATGVSESQKKAIAALETEKRTLQADKRELEAKRDRLTELAGVTEEGTLVASKDARIVTQYNAGKDLTSIRAAPEPLTVTGGSRADHYVSAAFSYPGQNMASPPDAVRVYIQTVFSGAEYRGLDQATFFIDDTAETVPVADYRSQKRSATRAAGKSRANLSNEVVVFELDPDTFERWSRAATIQGRMGRVTFEFTSDQIAALKALRKRIELGK